MVAKHDGKVLADFIVGKAMGTGTMVRPAGSNDVWRASGITKFIFDKGPRDWRDKGIITFPPADAEKLDIVSKDGAKISLKKTGTKAGNEDKWDVVSSSVKIDKLDNAVPNGIVLGARQLEDERLRRRRHAGAAGLDAPALTVTVGLKGGKSVTALVGGKKEATDEDTYVKKADAPQIFLVKKFNLDRVDKRPIEFRDKTLCDRRPPTSPRSRSAHGDKSYTLVKSGSDWKATKPPSWRSIRRKVTPIAGGVQGLEGDQLRRRPVAEGQRPRQAEERHQRQDQGWTSRANDACVVHVGDETQGQGQLLRDVRPRAPTSTWRPKWASTASWSSPTTSRRPPARTTAAGDPAKPGKPAGKLAANRERQRPCRAAGRAARGRRHVPRPRSRMRRACRRSSEAVSSRPERSSNSA